MLHKALQPVLLSLLLVLPSHYPSARLCWDFSKLCEVLLEEIVSWVSALIASSLSQLILSAHLSWDSMIFLLHLLWQVKPVLILHSLLHLRRENFQPRHLLVDPLNSLFSLGYWWSVQLNITLEYLLSLFPEGLLHVLFIVSHWVSPWQSALC